VIHGGRAYPPDIPALRSARTGNNGPVFERFSEHGKRVTVLAEEEARRAGHTELSADDLWLGILANRPGAGFHLLGQLGVDVNDLRARITTRTGGGPGSPAELKFAPDARKALELSLREALRLGDNYIGSEHIVVALLRQGTSEGAGVLLERGIGVPEAEAGLALIARESLPPANPAEQAGRWWRRQR
jgi:ATP-dependent Clp protease ATP-binding subunit ClpC